MFLNYPFNPTSNELSIFSTRSSSCCFSTHLSECLLLEDLINSVRGETFLLSRIWDWVTNLMNSSTSTAMT